MIFPMKGYPARVSIQSRECSAELLERQSGSALFPERPAGSVIITTVCREGGSVLYVMAPEMVDADEQIDYYLSLLPEEHAEEPGGRRSRVKVVGLADASARWLSDKILDPDLSASAAVRESIREFVRVERSRGADVRLSYFEPSANLEQLTRELGIPGDQAESRHIPLGTKAASRRLFAAAGIGVPVGTAECRSLEDLAAEVADMVRRGHSRLIIKLSSTEYGAGQGNAQLDLGDIQYRGDEEKLIREVLDRLPRAVLVDRKIGWMDFAAAFTSSGVIAEEFVAGAKARSPSFQGNINENGIARVVSTHEQILSGGQTYMGSSFPAEDCYRATIIDYGLRVGQELSGSGVRRGDYGVDFIAVPEGRRWRVLGCEVNLRATGTKHGFTMATGLLGVLPSEDGRLLIDGSERVYEASDSIADPRYVGLRPRQLIKSVQSSRLHYDPHQKTGVVLHMMSAAPRYGKFGAICIGTNRWEAAGMMSELRELADDLAESSSE